MEPKDVYNYEMARKKFFEEAQEHFNRCMADFIEALSEFCLLYIAFGGQVMKFKKVKPEHVYAAVYVTINNIREKMLHPAFHSSVFKASFSKAKRIGMQGLIERFTGEMKEK